jgi:hypothetical protein
MVNANEENRLEFESFNILDREYTHVGLLPDGLTTQAGLDLDVCIF